MNYKEKLKKAIFKERWVYPQLEDIQRFKLYAFSLSPEYQVAKSLLETDEVHSKMFTSLNESETISYKLYPELSTKSVNLHYHGYCQFSTNEQIGRFYAYVIPKLKDWGTFTIKELDTWDWYCYVRKQRHIMEPLCAYAGVPYKRKFKTMANFPRRALKKVSYPPPPNASYPPPRGIIISFPVHAGVWVPALCSIDLSEQL